MTALSRFSIALLAGVFWTSAGQAQDSEPRDETIRFGDESEDELPPEIQMGWNVPPREPEEDEPLTELDRLSQSPSGITFGLAFYDSKEDNPLKPVAVTLRALDKITARYRDLEIPIGEEAIFGPLTLLPRTCDKRPPEETPETTVFLEVFASEEDVQGARSRARLGQDVAVSEQPSTIVLPGEEPASEDELPPRPALFRGWMFASSPSLNALEHPVYDVWVIDCKMVEPEMEESDADI